MSFLSEFWPMLAVTLAVILLTGLGLALGSFFGRPPPRGSCGGLASGSSCACADAGKPQASCDEGAPSVGGPQVPGTGADALSQRADPGATDSARR